MATVNVTNWADFVTAVQVAGDTVVCPENAVWDMNEILPNGLSATITATCAKIKGNGTTIKNLHTTQGFLLFSSNSQQEMENLHVVNFAVDGGGLFGATSSVNGTKLIITGCKYSGILPATCTAFCASSYKFPEFVSCSFMVESQTSGMIMLGATDTYGNGGAKYCRIHMQLPGATAGESGFWQANCTWCKIDIDAPGATYLLTQGAMANVYGGNMPLCTAYYGFHRSEYISLMNIDEIPNVPAAPGYAELVTSEQLQDAEYLAGLGFPIGVEA